MRARAFRRFLALLGAVSSLAITVWLWLAIAAQQEMWPMPALYMVEMVALPGLAAALALRESRASRLGGWAIMGAIAAFVVLGAWGIGFVYSPVLLVLGIAAALAPNGSFRSDVAGLGVALLAAAAQAALILALTRIP
jgi:hypothetical protein